MITEQVPIYHTYDMTEELRLPEPGDKALCGHVKHTTDDGPFVPYWGQTCIVCADLDRDPE